jgi:hypothetical protein
MVYDVRFTKEARKDIAKLTLIMETDATVLANPPRSAGTPPLEGKWYRNPLLGGAGVGWQCSLGAEPLLMEAEPPQRVPRRSLGKQG